MGGEEGDYFGSVFCSERGEIISLEGIETFINLDTLNCYCNSIESLDLSSNKALTYMDCASNPLHSLPGILYGVITHLIRITFMLIFLPSTICYCGDL